MGASSVRAQNLEEPVQEPVGNFLELEDLTAASNNTITSATDIVTLEQIRAQSLEAGGEGDLTSSPMAQVTSVTQFSDVQPGDWAYEALSFLANSEDQGGLDCLEGYPDGTYRGNRALTRYEFAAGLAACLDAIGSSALDPEQLARIEALQREFASELAALRGRVDALEASVAELEENQFSTTTTLNGQVIMGFVGATGAYPGADEDDATPAILSNTNGEPGSDAQFSLNYRVRLNLVTSFSGNDLLITGLQAYSFRGDPNSIQGTLGYSDPQPVELNASNVRLGYEPQFPGVDPSDLSARSADDFYLYKLLYVFPGFDNVTFFVGSHAEVTDAFPNVSPFASETQGAISRFAPYNAAVRVSGGTSGTGLASAAGFIWDISDDINLTGLYGSVNASVSENRGLLGGTPLGAGIFNGSYVLAAQLTVRPSDTLNIALNYANSYHQINILGTGLSSSDIGSVLFNPSTNQLDAVGGDAVLAIANEGIRLNSLGGTLSWEFLPDLTLVLQGAYIFSDLTGVDASTNFISWMGGLHFQDVFSEGNTAGILFGQPLNRDSVGGNAFNPENNDPYQLEGYFSFRVSDNITITPGVFAVFNPEGYSGNDTAIVGVLRTALTF
ncbi:carbohydrate porin [Leptolyngbya sp. FACHB-16]|nr:MULTISPECIES: iron uptake porin [unclassified Leptolyngbya]MBD1909697.1 carbohydrate porin [Leptolyngbya sp. FACHB-8]MBD2155963.1 carbohydrate porin [Leptolyngbya sp. FACHB-16]